MARIIFNKQIYENLTGRAFLLKQTKDANDVFERRAK